METFTRDWRCKVSMPPTVYDAAEAAIKIERLERYNAALRADNQAAHALVLDLRAKEHSERTLAVKLEKENAALRDAINAMSPCKCQHAHGDACAMSSEIMALREERDALRAALVKIRELKPINMACDYWNKQLGLEPDEVFDICDAAIDAARKEAQP